MINRKLTFIVSQKIIYGDQIMVETETVSIHPVHPDTRRYFLPHIEMLVKAGFPSPADDYLEGKLELTEHLVDHPSATYYIRVSGDSMIDYGIFDHDLLVVDRSLDPRQGDIVIVSVDGELTCKALAIKNNIPYLKSGNPNYPPIEIKDKETMIWGVVIHTIHSFRNRNR